MIEYQQRYPEFPGEPWLEVPNWQVIRLRHIHKFRFRFHGKLVEKRRYLGAYIEKEIIYAKLKGQKLGYEMIDGKYKK